jgi:hypothetical protein
MRPLRSLTRADAPAAARPPPHAPTHQVRDEAAALAAAAGGTLRVGQLPAAGAPAAALAAAASAAPDVLVATPARVAAALRDGHFRPGALTRGLQFLGTHTTHTHTLSACVAALTERTHTCIRACALSRLLPCAAPLATSRSA